MFMISGSNEQLQQQLEYTLLKPDCHSWGISKMQSERQEERYAIKFCFKLGKMLQKRMECSRLHCSRKRLLRRGLEFISIKVPIRKKSGNLSYAPCKSRTVPRGTARMTQMN